MQQALFKESLKQVVKEDMMVSNMPTIRTKAVKSTRLQSLPTLHRDPMAPTSKEGVQIS